MTDKTTKELFKIAAAYIRVSDERQDEYSPDSQLKKIREFAAKDGYFIPDEYVFYDDGISAKTADKRKDFNRMIAAAKEKTRPFDVIFVWKFSRFARNQEESMVYKNLLRKKNINVISVSEPIPEGHFGSLIERIIEWMDEFYLINLGTEVTRGMTEKASRGEPTCAPPYGYVMKDKKYYPDEESGAANVVREIFKRYSEGEGTRAIALDLGQRGIRTKFNGMPENRWIEYILRNPCYTGKIRWSMDGARAVSKRDFKNEHILTVDGNHEPLVSKELFELVQEKLDEAKKHYPKWSRKEQPIDYMLKGLVRCSSCGATLTKSGISSGKNKTPCLQCYKYAHGSCKESHCIAMHKLEAAFIKGLEESIGSKSFKIVPKLKNIDPTSKPDFDKLIALEERKLQRAKEAYLAEVDTIEQYAKNKDEILKRIEDLKKFKENTTPEEPIDINEFSKKVEQIVKFIKRDDVSAKTKNEALHTIIEKVIYEKSKGNLDIYFFNP